MGTKQFDRRLHRLANEVERTRQKHRDRACPRHGRSTGLIRMLQMIGGQSGEFRGERRAAEVRQLIRMQFDRQSQRPGRAEHARRLLA